MFEELNKYNYKDHFVFNLNDSLIQVCNAPTDKSGVYLVYNGPELIYIGCSGKMGKDNLISVRKVGLGGMKDRLVNGYQFGKIKRRNSWPQQMEKENITSLKIYWYITHNKEYNDCPRKLENRLLLNHLGIYQRLPRWNKKL